MTAPVGNSHTIERDHMFLIRDVRVDDAPTLLKLAKMVHFINLPADPEIINRKVQLSRKSFNNTIAEPRDRQFLFVIEDPDTGNVIGTSSIISRMGGPGKPHTFFQVRKREHYSTDLNTGQVHVTLQLGTDESGPSEIGGLILSPAYRGHRSKLGMFLSLIRFHFIGMHRDWFSERIIAEMMAPLTPDSRNTLWEYLGRRFINLSYSEADRFCQHSKEFITSLLPKCEMYVSVLPPEARNLIGKVGKETEPAKAMLERIGFQYRNQVDPFDGGPYLEAMMDDIALVTSTGSVTLAGVDEQPKEDGLLSVYDGSHFRAVRCKFTATGSEVSIPQQAIDVLQASPGATLGLTPMSVFTKRRKVETTAHTEPALATEPVA